MCSQWVDLAAFYKIVVPQYAAKPASEEALTKNGFCMNIEIPTVDLSQFTDNEQLFAKQLGEYYREFGFVGFINHGISDQVIKDARMAFKAFFELDQSIKSKYQNRYQGGVRGYTGFGIEQAKDHNMPDLKEFWHIGKQPEDQSVIPDKVLPNIWPQEVPKMQTDGYRLCEALDKMGRIVLSALAVYLELEPDWFENKVDYGTSILRAIHYPPVTDIQAGQVRAAQHEDINLITLLVGSEQSGLEILTRDNQWVPVTTIEGTIVVNIGDMLQRLTNHLLPSTTHRVVNPKGRNILKPRYSMPYFLHFNPDFLIKTLPQCVNENNPDRYPQSITADGYLQERLREIKLV